MTCHRFVKTEKVKVMYLSQEHDKAELSPHLLQLLEFLMTFIFSVVIKDLTSQSDLFLSSLIGKLLTAYFALLLRENCDINKIKTSLE